MNGWHEYEGLGIATIAVTLSIQRSVLGSRLLQLGCQDFEFDAGRLTRLRVARADLPQVDIARFDRDRRGRSASGMPPRLMRSSWSCSRIASSCARSSMSNSSASTADRSTVLLALAASASRFHTPTHDISACGKFICSVNCSCTSSPFCISRTQGGPKRPIIIPPGPLGPICCSN